MFSRRALNRFQSQSSQLLSNQKKLRKHTVVPIPCFTLSQTSASVSSWTSPSRSSLSLLPPAEVSATARKFPRRHLKSSGVVPRPRNNSDNLYPGSSIGGAEPTTAFFVQPMSTSSASSSSPASSSSAQAEVKSKSNSQDHEQQQQQQVTAKVEAAETKPERKKLAKQLFREADAVCFDVDSTVVTEEGIDVLADHCGAGAAVADWTAKAMGGSVPFHEALEARLSLFFPSTKDIADCNSKHPLELSPGMKELAAKLHADGKHVYLVSGGFRQMIHPLAELLHIPITRVFANNLLFSEDGSYKGFDTEEPTSRAGGKAKVVGKIKKEFGYNTVIMVGDGATDMEARPPADAFIGFGGVVVRDSVEEGADWFVKDLNDLIQELSQ